MKRILCIAGFVLLAVLGCGTSLFAQGGSATKAKIASVTVEPGDVSPNGEATLVVKFSIALGWHIYSIQPNENSQPTTFTVKTPDVSIGGEIKEPAPVDHDMGGGIRVLYHEGEPVFRVPLKFGAVTAGELTIKGLIGFMACDDSGCLPPVEVPWSAKVNVKAAASAAPEAESFLPAGDFDPSSSASKARIKTATLEPQSIKAGGDATLVVTISVDEPFHIYSVQPNEFSQPTKFEIKTPGVTISGPIVEPTPKDEDMGGDIKVKILEGEPTFRIPLHFGAVPEGTTEIKATVLFMTCNQDGCLQAATIPFKAEVAGAAPSAGTAPNDPGTAAAVQGLKKAIGELADRLDGIEHLLAPPAPPAPPKKPAWEVGDVRTKLEKATMRAGETLKFSVSFTTPEKAVLKNVQDAFVDVLENTKESGAAARFESVQALRAESSSDGKSHTIDFEILAKDLARSGKSKASLEISVPMSVGGDEFEWRLPPQSIDLEFGLPSVWKWALKSIIAALLALLTPCVFPMIPVTVSFFTKQAEKQHINPVVLPSVYFAGIVGSFVLIGTLFTLGLGTHGAQVLATNGWLQGTFGVLFVVFALSLFGVITLTPPASLMAKAGSVRGKGGVVGTLGMGLLFSLTSFTCTAPLVGTLLVDAAESHEWQMPIIGMTAFAAVLGLPFFFLAMFPKLLASMPKSGGWMNTVKVTLGFLELAFALKFIGAADAYFGFAIFTRTVILWIWVVLFLANGLYLLGLFGFSHDTKPERISPIAAFLAIGFILLGLHMVKGTEGRVMPSMLESLLPPALDRAGDGGVFGWKNRIENDLEKAVALAKEKRVPLFMDFTGFT